MGTSSLPDGPGSNTPLVPTWLEEPDQEKPKQGEEKPAEDERPDQDDTSERPAIQPPPALKRFRPARRNFSSFARSGGSNTQALERAVRDYVRSGTGGRGKATRRMHTSAGLASRMLGIIRDFQRNGVETTLRRLDLQNMAGKSATEVFLDLTDIICRENEKSIDGGPIDEAVARDAWLETVAELLESGKTNLQSLITEEVQEIFLTFVSNTIQKRLLLDIGTKGLNLPADPSAIEKFQLQFYDYIRRGVRDAFSFDLTQLKELSDSEIKSTVNETYSNAWELLGKLKGLNE